MENKTGPEQIPKENTKPLSDMAAMTTAPIETASSRQKYWFQDLTVLLNLDLAGEVFPEKKMSYPQKVNAIVRFSWYLGILGAIVNTNVLWLYVPFVTMILTYVLYLFRFTENKRQAEIAKTLNATAAQTQVGQAQNQLTEAQLAQQKQQLSKFADYLDNTDGMCISPTGDNPFMNAMPFDNRLRAPGCNTVNNPAREIDLEMKYDDGRFRDANDIWNTNGGRRQFFTMPWTTYPNDQGSFANWLYRTPMTCKEGNGDQCVANIHDRGLYRRVESGIASGGAAK